MEIDPSAAVEAVSERLFGSLKKGQRVMVAESVPAVALPHLERAWLDRLIAEAEEDAEATGSVRTYIEGHWVGITAQWLRARRVALDG